MLVIGGSGSAVKRALSSKPNLMQCHSSYVVTDPKGSVVVECGKLLLRKGYRIKILNTINFKKSMHYNPFAYIHSEKDILKLVTTLIANTKGDGKTGDDFWREGRNAAVYGTNWVYPLRGSGVRAAISPRSLSLSTHPRCSEDDEDFKNPVDLMFDALADREPNHFRCAAI